MTFALPYVHPMPPHSFRQRYETSVLHLQNISNYNANCTHAQVVGIDVTYTVDTSLRSVMDRIGQSLLETFRHSLLHGLGYLAVTSGVAFGRAGVMDSVGNTILNTLGELLLGLVGDDGVALCVRLIHTGVESWCEFGFDKLCLDCLKWDARFGE